MSLILVSAFNLGEETVYTSKLVINHKCDVIERELSCKPVFPPVDTAKDTVSTCRASIRDFQEHVLTWTIRQHRLFNQINNSVQKCLGKPIPCTFEHQLYIFKQETQSWNKTTTAQMITCCAGIQKAKLTC